MKKILPCILVLLFCGIAKAQQYKDGYILPIDTAVLQKLSQWHALKFG